ncbi:MAG: hypothetical protein LBN43_10110, partial [Oscillospiraceae bacterium]|nr:hypothetical protein [Oscillospiraceae bacterium]
IGEVWEDASNKIAYGVRRRYFQGGQLDGTMNYPLRDAIVDYVLGGGADAIAAFMETFTGNTPKPALNCMMNVLSTHDTARILTVLGANALPETRAEAADFKLTDEEYDIGKKRLKLAAALQYTLPGFPCVYYGDEAGAQGTADPFNRMPFPWGREDHEMIDWYKHLGKLRVKYSDIFSSGDYQLIKAEGGEFTFSRDGKITISVNTDMITAVITVEAL